MGGLLRAEKVKMVFGDREVLSGLDLELDEAEAVAVVGANGAGKTTLIKILIGLLEPTAGGVHLQGERLQTLSRRQIARQVAVVPQGTPPVFAYQLLEFVLMGYHARSRLFLPSKDQIDGATRALEALNLDELADRCVSALSGGELQRALMARAMVADAALWLLDEPTASLDMHHQISLLGQVRAHVEAGGSALAVLHDLALVHRFFDRVVVLHDGQVLVEGQPDEALTSSVVSEVYGVEMQRGMVDGKVVWVVA